MGYLSEVLGWVAVLAIFGSAIGGTIQASKGRGHRHDRSS